MKDLYIIGAGGFGKEVAWLVERINKVNPTWNIVGYVDDNESLWNKKIYDYPVLGGISYLENCKDSYVVCAIGNADTKHAIIQKLRNYALQYATLIDPSVIMSRSVKIGEGTIICAGTIISVDVTIGKHVSIDWDCTIGHDDVISDFVTAYPSVNISGCCNIGERVELGTGMRIIQGLSIKDAAIVGAGACVVKNIEESGVYVGVPAKKIK